MDRRPNPRPRNMQKKREPALTGLHLALIGMAIVLIVAVSLTAFFKAGQKKLLRDQTSLIRLDQKDESGKKTDPSPSDTADQNPSATNGDPTASDSSEQTSSEAAAGTPEEILAAAERLSQMYDYDRALEELAKFPDQADTRVTTLKQSIEQTKSTLVAADPLTAPHVFFHSLIVDTAKAFDGDFQSVGYNQVMTTVSEFNLMMEEMHRRGFVLVREQDLLKRETNDAGQEVYSPATLMLPPGKKPFVLSVDDVNYYDYMKADGFANRIVIGKDGRPTCTMINDAGETVEGDFDVVPLLDKFVDAHPDFSYRGAKGILALTGYEGILGYRTDPRYQDENPNYEQDKATAKKVAQALRDHGWEFASHSWGHIGMGPSSSTYEGFVTDVDKWDQYVKPLLGDVEIMIYPFGQDVGDWQPYTPDNQRFQYLKSKGFNIFCNVDGTVPTWIQYGVGFMRHGRRNLDGYRLYNNPEQLEDLFDARAVFDKARPTPVPAY